MRKLMGNPLQLVLAAQALKPWAAGGQQASSSVRLRAVRPDGASREVMLKTSTRISEVLETWRL